jgi:hypothetical protein
MAELERLSRMSSMTTTTSETSMLPGRRTPARILVAALLAGASACSDYTAPVVTPPTAPSFAANNEKVKIKSLKLDANTLKIGGPECRGRFDDRQFWPADSNWNLDSRRYRSGHGDTSGDSVDAVAMSSGRPGRVPT